MTIRGQRRREKGRSLRHAPRYAGRPLEGSRVANMRVTRDPRDRLRVRARRPTYPEPGRAMVGQSRMPMLPAAEERRSELYYPAMMNPPVLVMLGDGPDAERQA